VLNLSLLNNYEMKNKKIFFFQLFIAIDIKINTIYIIMYRVFIIINLFYDLNQNPFFL